MLNLDTHVFIDFFSGALSPEEQRKISKDADQKLAISDIVLWELSKLVQLKRLDLNLNDPKFLHFIQAIEVLPISLEIAIQSTKLDFKSDPADEIIAATSIVNNIPLMTRDNKILKSKIVPFAKG